jgi:hypothetical protein
MSAGDDIDAEKNTIGSGLSDRRFDGRIRARAGLGGMLLFRFSGFLGERHRSIFDHLPKIAGVEKCHHEQKAAYRDS